MHDDVVARGANGGAARLGTDALHDAVEKLPEVPELVAIGRVLDRVEELMQEQRTVPGDRQP